MMFVGPGDRCLERREFAVEVGRLLWDFFALVFPTPKPPHTEGAAAQ
jgi:hypothetical protein